MKMGHDIGSAKDYRNLCRTLPDLFRLGRTNLLSLFLIGLFVITKVTAEKNPEKKKNQTPIVSSDGPCPTNEPMRSYFVDISGNVGDIGRSIEGPLCVQVAYNPIEMFVALESSTSSVSGPDLSKIVLGGAGAGGVARPTSLNFDLSGTDLPTVMQKLKTAEDSLKGHLNSAQSAYNTETQLETKAIADISQMRLAAQMSNEEDFPAAIKNGYNGLKGDLKKAVDAQATFTPTDMSDAQGNVLLSLTQQLEDTLARLPLEFATGNTAAVTNCVQSANVSWSAWYSSCKDSYYSPLKTLLDGDLQMATALTSTSNNIATLKNDVAIVNYWNALFIKLGLSSNNGTVTGIYAHAEVKCTGLFNNTTSTAINLVVADLTPTLTGGTPTTKSQNPFVTVTCSTPLVISAGVGFSTIEQKQFAILQSSDGKGGIVNTFGTTSDSKVTPIALAVTHVRLHEWARHEAGIFGSFGIGGNLQTISPSSPVYFLPGMSLGLWRTMYITVGAGIGQSASLAGGYKEGDPVPSGISSVTGLTKTSYTGGFGFALTFTKP